MGHPVPSPLRSGNTSPTGCVLGQGKTASTAQRGSLGSRAGNHVSSVRMEKSEEQKEIEMERAPLSLYAERCFVTLC